MKSFTAHRASLISTAAYFSIMAMELPIAGSKPRLDSLKTHHVISVIFHMSKAKLIRFLAGYRCPQLPIFQMKIVSHLCE